jgi:phosphoglycolate phosphatase
MEEDNLVVEKMGGKIYEGVESGLKALAERVPLFIVSNCQSGYIETFLKFSGFGKFFKDFECWGNTRKPKSENLADVIARNNLKNSIFVGDAEGDRVAAKSCKVPFHFMEYGFGTVIDCDASFSSFGQFTDYLISVSSS